jgi:hypothetical protein
MHGGVLFSHKEEQNYAVCRKWVELSSPCEVKEASVTKTSITCSVTWNPEVGKVKVDQYEDGGEQVEEEGRVRRSNRR